MAESESEHDDDDEEDEELAEEKPEPPKTSASASTVYQPKRIQTETSSSVFCPFFTINIHSRLFLLFQALQRPLWSQQKNRLQLSKNLQNP